MNQLERQLLQETTGGVEPQLAVRSRTRIDTGRWWWPTRAWVCVMADELVVLGVSRRRYVARAPLVECAATHYCHTTGELVIGPCEELEFSRLRVSPREALELMKAMKLKEPEEIKKKD
ncbi:MAG: hypothetical protein HN919_20040 [Verrucomicrobia bacterium]|jgi:hypothetical protein|nr:hypothetical protein [Verrucomicrobiota bacterium]MBT7068597.1 hypothetical protein [Verrucomicrobiota bacterium]MBT7698739.1 hypothetical protein [Verrucomicrobiota bacterium]